MIRICSCHISFQDVHVIPLETNHRDSSVNMIRFTRILLRVMPFTIRPVRRVSFKPKRQRINLY